MSNDTEYGVVTRSEEALKKAAVEHGFDPDDVYIISSLNDFKFMRDELGDKDYTLIFADDHAETGIKPKDIMPDYDVAALGVRL